MAAHLLPGTAPPATVTITRLGVVAGGAHDEAPTAWVGGGLVLPSRSADQVQPRLVRTTVGYGRNTTGAPESTLIRCPFNVAGNGPSTALPSAL